MKVKELKKILSRFPKDALVTIQIDESSGNELIIRAKTYQDGRWEVVITSEKNLEENEENILTN